MSMITNDAKGIIGHIIGDEPENELEHFYVCCDCGQAVDMRDLGQVFHHEVLGHEHHDTD